MTGANFQQIVMPKFTTQLKFNEEVEMIFCLLLIHTSSVPKKKADCHFLALSKLKIIYFKVFHFLGNCMIKFGQFFWTIFKSEL